MYLLPVSYTHLDVYKRQFLGYKWDDILLVNVENVSNVTKLFLIIFYIVIFKNTELDVYKRQAAQ